MNLKFFRHPEAALFRICGLVVLISRTPKDYWCLGAFSPAFSLLEAGLKVGESRGAARNGGSPTRKPVFCTTTMMDGAYPLDLSKSTPDSEMLRTQCFGTVADHAEPSRH